MAKFGMAKYVLIGALFVFILGLVFLSLEEKRKDQRDNKVVVSGHLVIKGDQVCVESTDQKFPVLSCWGKEE